MDLINDDNNNDMDLLDVLEEITNVAESPASTLSDAPTFSPKRESQQTVDMIFRGQPISHAVGPQCRLVSFVRRYYTFINVYDESLRADLASLTLFDEEDWEYEEGTNTYRLADLTYLLHRICEDPQLRQAEHFQDHQQLCNWLSTELDGFQQPQAQIDLSLARDENGPTDWLRYFYWAHIVNHLQAFQPVVVRVDCNNKVTPFGLPRAGRIFGARECAGGLLVCVGWNWGLDTVLVQDITNINAFGIFFADSRMQSNSLLQGWSMQQIPYHSNADVADTYWGLGGHRGA